MNLTEYIEWLDKNLKYNTVIEEKDCKFYNVLEDPFDLYGFYEPKKSGEFCRVPETVTKNLSVGMQYFAKDTSGGRVRFKTDSRYVAISVKMPYLPTRNMPLSGCMGFDLFIDKKHRSEFYKTYIPPMGFEKGWEGIIYFPDRKERYITINFPLYSHVNQLDIGLQKDATLGHGKEYAIKKPFVFYGGSHVQGASASKPGNSAQGFFSRKLDCDFINLGFSGNALGELKMAEYIAGLDPTALFMEYDHNAPDADFLKKTHYAFYEKVRTLRPELPFIMISKHDFYTCSYYVKTQKENVERRKVVIESFEKAKANGDKKVWFIDGKDMLAGDDRSSCTMDGTHPNDLGFYRIAKKYVAWYKKYLQK